MKPAQKKQSPLRKRASLRVPRVSGQEAIRILCQQNLIDHGYRIASSKNHVFIPLSRKLSKTETIDLGTKLGATQQGDRSFPVRSRPKKTLRDALANKIPETLLASLPSSYNIIGDIAVLDLSSKVSAYETVIADGIREVNRNVSVVLARRGSVSGQERVLPTRLLAGEDRTITVHKELGCRFKVDLSKAYFSPRLSHEHERIAGLVEEGEVVTDLFSGVGPFSIMIAKRLKEVEVNAVDANADAVDLIRENLTLNNVETRVRVWLGDARRVVETDLHGKASRVIMNHPSAAHEFVDVALRALRKDGGIIHYYTFAQGSDCEAKAVLELEEGLARFDWRAKWLAQARRVREVAPMKWQVAVDAPVAPISLD